jgi:hypothetical protein
VVPDAPGPGERPVKSQEAAAAMKVPASGEWKAPRTKPSSPESVTDLAGSGRQGPLGAATGRLAQKARVQEDGP